MQNTASASQESVIGYFENVTGQLATGWAYSRRSPNEKLTVDIVCKDELVGRGVANVPRHDLKDAGFGDGAHAFSIPLSDTLRTGVSHELIAIPSGTNIPLKGRLTYAPTSKRPKFPQISRSEARSFFVDYLARSALRYPLSPAAVYQAYVLSSLLQETGSPHQARAAYKTIANKIGENVLLACKIAETHVAADELTSALEVYTAASAFDPTATWPLTGLGHLRLYKGDYAKAHKSYAAADALHSSLKTRARVAIARIAAASGSVEERLQQNEVASLIGCISDLSFEHDTTDVLAKHYAAQAQEKLAAIPPSSSRDAAIALHTECLLVRALIETQTSHDAR